MLIPTLTVRRLIIVGLMLVSLVALADSMANAQLANAVAGFQSASAGAAG